MAVLFSVSVAIEITHAPKEISGTIPEEIPGKAVLGSFIMFNETVTRETKFFTEAERAICDPFERATYSMLNNEPIFTCKIAATIDDVTDDCAASR
jgi:hypothetical protein